MSDNSNFPEEPRPILVEECKDNAVRARLVEIENLNRPGTRKNNAVHIELFDKLKIGRLIRTEHETIWSGDNEKYKIDNGIFLCARNTQNIQIFHSNSDRHTCQKCIDIANRLIRKGLDIYTVNEASWKILQEFYALDIFNTRAKTNQKIKEYLSKSDSENN